MEINFVHQQKFQHKVKVAMNIGDFTTEAYLMK